MSGSSCLSCIMSSIIHQNLSQFRNNNQRLGPLPSHIKFYNLTFPPIPDYSPKLVHTIYNFHQGRTWTWGSMSTEARASPLTVLFLKCMNKT